MKSDSTNKVIVLLLILAIVFSAISIIIGLSALKNDLPAESAPSDDNSAGTLGFVVEGSKSSEGGK